MANKVDRDDEYRQGNVWIRILKLMKSGQTCPLSSVIDQKLDRNTFRMFRIYIKHFTNIRIND